MNKVVFTLEDMVTSLRSAMSKFPDNRKGRNTRYEVMDAASSAFSVFFTQSPSFLEYQKIMQDRYSLSNCKTIFGVKDIPSDNQIRNLLDGVNPYLLQSVFDDCFNALEKSGNIAIYNTSLGDNNNDFLIALDGVQYFCSEDVSCQNCSRRKKDGILYNTHQMVTPTIVAPKINKVISLFPSFVTPQDATGKDPSPSGRDSKQDCELKASKRWLNTLSNNIQTVTLLGDDLYSHIPFCRKVLNKGFNFIFVCKPESHKIVFEWIKGITKEIKVDRFDGKQHLLYEYSYAEGIPLKFEEKSDDKELLVNFVEVTVIERKTRKKVYHNSWITNHKIEFEIEEKTKERLNILTDSGRARWKVENENNNTLKNQGYHLEHNFGHGKETLSQLLATFNILSFLFHTTLEFMNEKYQLLRKVIGARVRFFNDMRTLLSYHPYRSFDNLLAFMIKALKNPIPIEELHYPL